MNAPETINIEKYAEALNELIGVDSAYMAGDKSVDAIVELIVAAKKLENRVKKLTEENERLRTERNEVTTNSLLEFSAIISYLRSLIKKSDVGLYNYPVITHEFLDKLEKERLGGHKDPVGERGECGLKRDCVADAVCRMQERLKYSLCCVPQCHFTYAEVEFHIDRIAKEVLEENK